MKRKSKLGLIGFGVILISLGMFMVYNQEQKEINVGYVGPLTGGPALWGQASLDMVELAIDEINTNGGVNGKKINLVVEDGKCNANDAVSATRKLIDVDGVKFIIGGHCSPETVAMVPIINENEVFMIAGVTSADEAVSGSKFAYRTSPSTLEQAQIVSDLAYNKYGFRNIATITEQAAYAKSFTDDVKKTFNGVIVEEVYYDPLETDFRSNLLKIKTKNPDAIWISPQDPNEAVLILKQMKELGMENIPLLGNTIFISSNVYENSGGLLPRDAFTVTLFADSKSPRSIEIQNKYKSKYGKDVPYNLYYISATYDATYMLRDALEKCGEDSKCVAGYFDSLENYEGVAGRFTFDLKGDPIFDSWKEMKIVDGKVVIS